MGIVVCNIGTSLDGYLAGPNQTLETPMGEGVDGLHRWQFEQRERNADEVARQVSSGAFIMGRNMFGPDRGDWDLDWTGWWGEEPPYHAPVFVLSHRPRESLVMQGGTTFHFVTDGIHSALEQAKAAAGDADVAIAGGASTVNQYLNAGLIDEIRISVAPIVIGSGARLFDGVAGLKLEPIYAVGNELVTHLRYRVLPAG
ncbi:dihydrofolate reductase family protein [Microbacteriaceae bacterium VKM Ac-2854]|nr:dihydrofolate reductase family protein [Microbacteriaceae bacterium VKM Ac-2854]